MSSVTSIGEGAFQFATALNSVYFLGIAPTTVGDRAFNDVASGAIAYVITTTDFGGIGVNWNGLIIAPSIA